MFDVVPFGGGSRIILLWRIKKRANSPIFFQGKRINIFVRKTHRGCDINTISSDGYEGTGSVNYDMYNTMLECGKAIGVINTTSINDGKNHHQHKILNN